MGILSAVPEVTGSGAPSFTVYDVVPVAKVAVNFAEGFSACT